MLGSSAGRQVDPGVRGSGGNLYVCFIALNPKTLNTKTLNPYTPNRTAETLQIDACEALLDPDVPWPV